MCSRSTRTGTNRTSIKGRVIAPDSSGRRIRNPQAPPNWRWIISSAASPSRSQPEHEREEVRLVEGYARFQERGGEDRAGPPPPARRPRPPGRGPGVVDKREQGSVRVHFLTSACRGLSTGFGRPGRRRPGPVPSARPPEVVGVGVLANRRAGVGGDGPAVLHGNPGLVRVHSARGRG